MADAIVSAVIDQLVTIGEQEVKLVVGVEEEVEKMSNTFKTIQAVLVDAEKRQFQEEAVKFWLNKLKHISYDIEDVLDEWNSAIRKSQIEHHQILSTPSLLSKVRSCIPSPCSCFARLALRHDIGVKIRELNEKLQAISKEKDKFSFLVNPRNNNDLEIERPPKTTYFVDVSEIRGRDQDKDIVRSMLLNENNPPMISIVGMGGIGKTTLAQLVYNHHHIGSYFHKKIWVCVSDPFDEMRIAKAILESLTNSASSFSELATLLEKIHESLVENKIRYLLVLDDVWNEDERKWRSLKHCLLNSGSQGSKILVTTRKDNVATIMGCTKLFHLGELSRDECWSLFSGIAFSGRSDSDRVNLEHIGKKIAKRCKGLPLAAKTLGVLLRFKRSREQWERILNSHLWELNEVEKGLFSPLLLRYYDLPAPIRRCFSYCAIFPKDHVIEKDLLIKLWMAQGYLRGVGGDEMEIVGEDYFDNLATRSFFQEFRKDKNDDSIIKNWKMHDIVHDFAQLLRKDECCVMRARKAMEEPTADFYDENARHLTLIRDNERRGIPDLTYNLKKLRNLFLVDSSNYARNVTLELDACLPKLFDQLTCLRMLRLNNNRRNSIKKLPQEIGKLIHLRYLSVEDNEELRELPETLCDLCNLQTVNIRGCQNLEKLPRGMEKLINLRHFQNRGTDRIEFMPKGMERLTSLQTLELFVLDDRARDSCRLQDLGKLINLRGHLEIKRFGDYVGEARPREAILSARLRSLSLHFWRGLDEEAQKQIEDVASLLQALEPPQHLQSLWIGSCKGHVFPFPNWMTSLTSLKRVELSLCTKWESLPPMGKLPSLESLSIRCMEEVKKVGEEFLGVETSSSSSDIQNIVYFPNLKQLRFYDMKGWEEWEYGLRSSGGEGDPSSSNNIPIIIMPILQRLVIHSCRKLKMLPRHILQSRSLQQLEIKTCDILRGRYNKNTGDHWPSISHIPTVKISNW